MIASLPLQLTLVSCKLGGNTFVYDSPSTVILLQLTTYYCAREVEV